MSIASPYLITTGAHNGACNHDIRMKHSVINRIVELSGEIASATWSANSSPDSMKISDPT